MKLISLDCRHEKFFDESHTTHIVVPDLLGYKTSFFFCCTKQPNVLESGEEDLCDIAWRACCRCQQKRVSETKSSQFLCVVGSIPSSFWWQHITIIFKRQQKWDDWRMCLDNVLEYFSFFLLSDFSNPHGNFQFAINFPTTRHRVVRLWEEKGARSIW